MRKNYITLVYLPDDEENANFLADILEEKHVEVRILKEKSQAIQPGDFITFHHIDDSSKIMSVYINDSTASLANFLKQHNI